MKNLEKIETATDIKTKAMLQDLSFVLALSKRLAKEIRQGKEFGHVEASRAWSEEESQVYVAA